ncbi:MAG: IS21 family transposase [Planctomycetes bacterium]|nr:IS21 family transposase [Planctomycetota bacterium]
MANQLKMAKVHTILTLRARGWSYRRIGRELGVHRETAARYARLAEVSLETGSGDFARQDRSKLSAGSDVQNQPNPPAGLDDQNRPNPPTGSEPQSSGPRSLAEPFREFIIQCLDQGLSRQRIWQDLKTEHAFEGSYDSVKRFARRLQTDGALPFRRMECAAGEEAQIDFGTGAPIVMPNGKRRRSHVLRVVLSHSRKAYSEVVFRQTTEQFIRCIENAFCHFGGVPKTLVIDNLKAAVTKADWFDPEINPKMLAFCAHYDTTVLPTKPYTPRHKGKVERGVDYVQNNALKGKSFKSLSEQNEYLLRWETTVADTRIHGTTRRQVQKAFEESERAALLPLPVARFPFFEEVERKVNRDGHVEVDKSYYSAPPEYLTRTVWVRWDSRVVRIFNRRMEQIAFHVKREPGRFSTQSQHIAERKRSGIEKGAVYQLNKARLIGTETGRWAEQMIHQRGIEGVRVLMGLLNLAHRHSSESIEQACALAASHGAYRLRTIRELLKRQGDKQERFEFLDEHPIIRPLTDYGKLVHTAFGKE